MLPKWGEICKQTGSELWWWSYCTTITYSLAGCPNVFETYYDIKYLVDECNVSGIYCEGGGYDYNFEDLKYHMFSWMMYDPDVTFEEYCDEVKDFLYLYYGNGYLELYEYLIMQKAAGDATGCFVNNHNRPGDMYSYDYVKENYEKMRALLTTALEKAEEEMYEKRIEMLIVCCDFMGLSAAYNDMYKNGTEDTRAVYCERYDSMYNYLKDNNLPICDGPYELPAKMSYELTPITQFYDRGSWTVSDWAQDSPIPYKPFAEGYQSER